MCFGVEVVVVGEEKARAWETLVTGVIQTMRRWSGIEVVQGLGNLIDACSESRRNECVW